MSKYNVMAGVGSRKVREFLGYVNRKITRVLYTESCVEMMHRLLKDGKNPRKYVTIGDKVSRLKQPMCLSLFIKIKQAEAQDAKTA